MLSCRQVTELCSQELDRQLGLGERVSLKAHIMMCSGCANYRRQLFTLREVARAYAEGRAAAALPPEQSE